MKYGALFETVTENTNGVDNLLSERKPLILKKPRCYDGETGLKLKIFVLESKVKKLGLLRIIFTGLNSSSTNLGKRYSNSPFRSIF